MITKQQTKKIYDLVSSSDNAAYALYQDVNEFSETSPLTTLLREMGIPNNNESRLAAADRIAGMREDSIVNVMKSLNYTDEGIEKQLKIAFVFVSQYYEVHQKKLLDDILKLHIPTMYKILFSANFNIGKLMTVLHKEWELAIVDGANKELTNRFGSTSEVLDFLNKNKLFDDGHYGKQADRSYSVLVPTETGYSVKTYAEAFPVSVKAITFALSDAILALSDPSMNDDTESRIWVKYFQSFRDAISCLDRHNCVSLWAQVDRDWMKITGPIQMVHPIEYYDDFLRNAVSIEWDLRVDDPDSLDNIRGKSVLSMFKSKFHFFTGKTAEGNALGELIIHNMEKVQLHIGKQVFFSGSQYKGLASAQVIPNDEVVSSEEGKKIFAFSEKSVNLGRSKPPLLITREVFGEEITKFQHNLLFNRKSDYLTVYDITTIGHEYGHVLWKGMDTEINMNASGNFKNIEEFKASAGGMVAFFGSEEEKKLWKEVLLNTVQRAVRLISWKNVDEVKPYYCEALITLNILFNSYVLQYKNDVLTIDVSEDSYSRFQAVYMGTYDLLVQDYLKEVDANEFLFKFVKFSTNEFLPIDENIEAFVLYYYELNKKIGRTIDTKTDF